MPIDILGAVTMVTVRIHNGNPVDGIGLPQVFDHDGFNVDIAKPPGTVHDPHGVMAGRTHERKTPFNLPVQYGHADGFSTAGTNQMGFGGHAPFVRHTKVNALDVLYSHRIRFEFRDALDIEDPFFEDLVLGVKQPLFSFRMGGIDGPVEGGEEDETGFVFGCQRLSSLHRNSKFEFRNSKQILNSKIQNMFGI